MEKQRDFLTVHGAADLAAKTGHNVAAWGILRAVSSGQLRAEKVTVNGKEKLFLAPSEVMRWLDAQGAART